MGSLLFLLFLGIQHLVAHSHNFRVAKQPEPMRVSTRKSLYQRDKIPFLLKLLSTKNDDGRVYELFGCKLQNSLDKCLSTFKAEPKCLEHLSLGNVFHSLAGDSFTERLGTIIYNIFPPGAFAVERIILAVCEPNEKNVKKGNVEFVAKVVREFDLINNKVKVSQGSLSLSFNHSDLNKDFNITKIGATLSGSVEIVGQKMTLELQKERESRAAKFRFEAENLEVAAFLKLFSRGFDEMEDKEVAQAFQQNRLFSSAVIKNALLTGFKDNIGNYEIISKGAVKSVEGLDHAKGFVIVQKYVETPIAVGIVLAIKNVQPMKIISLLSGKQLDHIEILKDLAVDLYIEYANKPMKIVGNTKIDDSGFREYFKNKTEPMNGILLGMNIPIRRILQDIDTSSDIEHISENIPITVSLHDDQVVFKFPDNVINDGMNVLAVLAPDIVGLLNKYVFRTKFRVLLQKYNVHLTNKTIDIALFLPDTVVVGNDFVTLKNVFMEINHHPQKGTTGFQLSGEMNFNGVMAQFSLLKKDQKFIIGGSLDSIRLEQLLQMYLKSIGIETTSLLNHCNFLLKDVGFTGFFGDSVMQELRIKGTPVLGNWDNLKFEALVRKKIGLLGKKRHHIHHWMSKEQRILNRYKRSLEDGFEMDNIAEIGKLNKETTDVIDDIIDNIPKVSAESFNRNIEQPVNNTIFSPDSNNRISNQSRLEMQALTEKNLESQSLNKANVWVMHNNTTKSDGKEGLILSNRITESFSNSTARNGTSEITLGDRKTETNDHTPSKSTGDDETEFALAMLLKNIRLDDLIERLFQRTYMGTNWLVNLNIALVVSNVAGEVKLALLNGMGFEQVSKGVYFSGLLTVPEDCLKNALCELAKLKMAKDAKLTVNANYKSVGFVFKASYYGGALHFGEKVQMKEVFFELKINKNYSMMSLNGAMTVQLSGENVQFTASIMLSSVTFLTFSAGMSGMWTRPFGIPNFAIGNVHISTNLQAPFTLNRLTLSGQMNLGKTGSAIIVKASGGFNVNNPKETLVYGSINELSLRDCAEAFGYKLSFSQLIQDTGFPKGLQMGFSTNPKGTYLEAFGIHVKPGYSFQGVIRILGFEVQCTINIEPTKLFLDAELSAINLFNGAFVLSFSTVDLSRGPKVYINILPNEATVVIKGSVTVLGISAEVSLDVNDEGIRLELNGKLFSIAEVKLLVSAKYKKKMEINDTEFKVSGCLILGNQEAADEANRIVKEATTRAQDIVKVTEETTEKKAAWYSRLAEKLSYLRSRLWRTEKDMSETAARLQKQRIKQYQTCITICNNRFMFYMRHICLATCINDKVFVSMKIKAKLKFQSGLLGRYVVFVRVVDKSEEIVRRSKIVMSRFQKLVASVRSFAASAIQLAKDIAGFVKERIFDVHRVCFNTTLQSAARACFGLDVSLTVLKRKMELRLEDVCFQAGLFKSIGKAITHVLYPGISNMNEKIKETQANLEKIEQEKKELEAMHASVMKDGEVVMADKNMIPDDDDDDEDEGFRKSEIHRNWTLEECNKQLYSEFPVVTLNDEDVIEALDTTPDYFVENQLKSRADISIELPAFYRQLSFPKDKCALTKLLVRKYQMISGHVASVFDELQEKKKQLQTEAAEATPAFARLETKILNKCKRAGFTKEEQANVLKWSHRFSEAQESRMKNLDSYFNQLENRMMNSTGVSLVRQVERSGVNVKDFIERLGEATQTVVRGDIQHSENVAHKLNEALKVMQGLLHEGGDSEMKLFRSIRDNMTYLRQQMPCAA